MPIIKDWLSLLQGSSKLRALKFDIVVFWLFMPMSVVNMDVVVDFVRLSIKFIVESVDGGIVGSDVGLFVGIPVGWYTGSDVVEAVGSNDGGVVGSVVG